MTAQYLLNELSTSTEILQIKCNDGAVHINPLTFDFTYVGKFGRSILLPILKNNCANDLAKKLTVLEIYANEYSKRVGGITITH